MMLNKYCQIFIWDNQTTVDKRPAQEPSIYVTGFPYENLNVVVEVVVVVIAVVVVVSCWILSWLRLVR